MLSNAHFLAKFCFDTAENEPAKNLQNLQNLLILLTLTLRPPPLRLRDGRGEVGPGEGIRPPREEVLGPAAGSPRNSAKFRETKTNVNEDYSWTTYQI